MSSFFLNKQISKAKAKKKCWNAFSLYLRRKWTLQGFTTCYTCDKHLVFKSAKRGDCVMVGHWVEGHSNVTYISEIYVRPQCFVCNLMMGGNQGEFRDRIRKELGNAEVDRLLIEAHKTLEISASDYMQRESYYKELLKTLDK